MRVANVDGRAFLLTTTTSGHDIATASDGRFGPDLAALYEAWEDFAAWTRTFQPGRAPVSFDRAQLGPPSPAPRQILAIGLNYSKHADETGFQAPDLRPSVFTKFVSSLAGPDCEVVLPSGGHTDWEVELVAVIGREGHKIPAANAWQHVAGLTIGQDISERVLQMATSPPQFSLGKSYPRFAPTGPWIVTPDEFPNRDDIQLGCSIDGEILQSGRTGDLIFTVAQLIEELSKVVTLLPGDLIFTGTPDGVGLGRVPARWLQPGERLRTWITGIGEMQQTFVAAE